MKVKELIKILQEQDPNRICVLSCDAEGNYFSPLSDVSTYLYDKNEHSIGLEELTKELREEGYSEEDLGEGKPALVFWP